MEKYSTQFIEDETDQLISFVVSEASKERAESTLETASHFENRLKGQLHKSLKEFQQRIQAAMQQLDNQKLWPQNERFKAVEKLFNNEQKEKRNRTM